jgi:hypothetical protein
MQKTSKNSKNVKKVTKKSINPRYCTVLYLSWGLLDFAEILHKFTSKKCLLHSLAFPFFKKSHFCIKKQPPRRILNSPVIFLFYVFEAPLLSSGSRAQRRRCRPLSSTCCWRPRPRLQGRPRLYSLGGRFSTPRSLASTVYIRSDPGG